MLNISDIVTFRKDLIFNGAVDLDWLAIQPVKAKEATRSFVFHGPQYHTANQDDNISIGEHRLIDTASFTRDILKQTQQLPLDNNSPFTLAISGYGTGKSHLAVTLASILKNPKSDEAVYAVENLKRSNAQIAEEIDSFWSSKIKPCITVALNGIGKFDLTNKIIEQIRKALEIDGQDCSFFDEHRPRFNNAAKMLGLLRSDNEKIKELCSETGCASLDSIVNELQSQNEQVYKNVHGFLEKLGVPVATTDESSLKETLDDVVKRFCGDTKPYSSIIIVFDEFGKYLEFAATSPHLAGSGALQTLFEAVESNTEYVKMLCFIQYSLEAYAKRLSKELRNEQQRYISRFQNARRVYLSINLETLLANLLEKKAPYKKELFERKFSTCRADINTYLPASTNYKIWNDQILFDSIVVDGCAPLSPLSTWVLFYLASAGKVLQGRSVFAILSDTFERLAKEKQDDIADLIVNATDLFGYGIESSILREEFLSSEEFGQQGNITHSLCTVLEKHGQNLSIHERKTLVAIMLASKLQIKVADKNEVAKAYSLLSGLTPQLVKSSLQRLETDTNDILWDAGHKCYEIISDGLPRQEFVRMLETQASEQITSKDSGDIFLEQKDALSGFLNEYNPGFAADAKHPISSSEFIFNAVITSIQTLQISLKVHHESWLESIDEKKPRGTIFYVYVDALADIDLYKRQAKQLLQHIAKDSKHSSIPFLICFLHDSENNLLKNLAKLSILKLLTEQEKIKYGNLIPAELEKVQNQISDLVPELLMERNFATSIDDLDTNKRIQLVCRDIFERVYTSIIPFPYDGINNPIYKMKLISVASNLITRDLKWMDIVTMDDETVRRIEAVLLNNWACFNNNGSITKKPGNQNVSILISQWDEQIQKGQNFDLEQVIIKACQAPYGANIYSALLLISVFISARRNTLNLVKKTPYTVLDFQHLGNTLTSSARKLTSKSFKDYSLELKQLGEDGLWLDKIQSWESETCYKTRIEHKSDALELLKKIGNPSGELAIRFESLLQLSKHEKDDLERFEAKLSSLQKNQEQSFNSMDFEGSTFNTRSLKELTENSEKWWHPEDHASVENSYRNGRKFIELQFDSYLENLSINSNPETFSKKILKIISALRILNFENQANILEERKNQLITEQNTKHKINLEYKQIKDWSDKYIFQSRTYSYHSTSIEIAKKHKRTLSAIYKQYNNKNIAALITAVTSIIEHSSNEITIKLADINTIQENCPLNKDSLNITESKIKQLNSFFDTTETQDKMLDLKYDFAIIDSWFKQLYEISSQEELKRTAGVLKKNLQKESFFWDVDSCLEKMCNEIHRVKSTDSQRWLEQIKSVKINPRDKSDVLIEILEQRLFKLRDNPPYSIESVENERQKLILETQEKLNHLIVEWMLAKYKDLNPQQKSTFKQKIISL